MKPSRPDIKDGTEILAPTTNILSINPSLNAMNEENLLASLLL